MSVKVQLGLAVGGVITALVLVAAIPAEAQTRYRAGNNAPRGMRITPPSQASQTGISAPTYGNTGYGSYDKTIGSAYGNPYGNVQTLSAPPRR